MLMFCELRVLKFPVKFALTPVLPNIERGVGGEAHVLYKIYSCLYIKLNCKQEHITEVVHFFGAQATCTRMSPTTTTTMSQLVVTVGCGDTCS